MVEVFVPLFLFGLGTSVGSFVNVAIFRFGFQERASARSRCMACDAPIAWYDLIPILSYALLRGRCRGCGSSLSSQYPLVELGTGLLFALSFRYFPSLISFFPLLAYFSLLVFLAALLALTVYDIRHTLVPLPFTGFLAGSALFAAAAKSMASESFFPLVDGLLGAVALFGFFFAVYLLTRGRGMGLGDAYVAGAGGILLGLFRGIEAVMFGVWSGTAFYLLALLLSSSVLGMRLFAKYPRVTIRSELPLVPFLALGIAIALFTDLSPLSTAATFGILWGY